MRGSLGRATSKAIKAYWFAFRPRTYGVKCLIEHDGRWLFIRNSYGVKHWTFPGGGIRRGELPEEAAKREVAEEVGIELDEVEPIGVYRSTKQFKRDTVYCFRALVDSPAHQIDGREVMESCWFPKTDVPRFRSRAVDCVIGFLEDRPP